MVMIPLAVSIALLDGEFYHECKDKHCKTECHAPDILRLSSYWEGNLGEKIQIQECGNDFRIRFFMIDFHCFKPHEIITLEPIEDVSVSNTVITCDNHGKAKLILFALNPSRKMKVLDFNFNFRNQHHTMSVNKFLPELQPEPEPEVIETPKSKPVTKSMPMPGKRV